VFSDSNMTASWRNSMFTVAVCYSVLQCFTVSRGSSPSRTSWPVRAHLCPLSQCVAACCSAIQCVELCFPSQLLVLFAQRHVSTVAACCSMLQHVAACCSVFSTTIMIAFLRKDVCPLLQCIAECCIGFRVFQCIAVHFLSLT